MIIYYVNTNMTNQVYRGASLGLAKKVYEFEVRCGTNYTVELIKLDYDLAETTTIRRYLHSEGTER